MIPVVEVLDNPASSHMVAINSDPLGKRNSSSIVYGDFAVEGMENV